MNYLANDVHFLELLLGPLVVCRSFDFEVVTDSTKFIHYRKRTPHIHSLSLYTSTFTKAVTPTQQLTPARLPVRRQVRTGWNRRGTSTHSEHTTTHIVYGH